jgi:3-hydroxyacyl-CoA dehydrogenase
MSRPIRSIAVLGAGTMGAQIAAHAANAGLPVTLLDVTAAAARDGLKRAMALTPDPFFTRQVPTLISTGGFDQDLGRVAEADWIIEAVVEQIDAKRRLFEQVDQVRRQDTLVTSNTSGIPIASLAEGRSDSFRSHFLGTHFFNPPRYMRLVEVVPTRETVPAVLNAVVDVADRRLGKGVVVARDTPGFIANRIAIFGVVQTLRALETGEYTIEEIDAITGPALGRPKSATFRTLDIAGLDVLGQVARNLVDRLGEESKDAFLLPAFVDALIERSWLGNKTGQGFYKRDGSDILTLEIPSLTYRPRQPARLAALDAAESIGDLVERTRVLFTGSDKVGAFLRRTLGPTLVYAARVAPAIAPLIDDVDRAMRWGFLWQLGPFELWDAIGIHNVLDAVSSDAVPPLVQDLVDSGRDRFREGTLPPAAPELLILKSRKEGAQVVRTTEGASLVDLGDGVLAVDLHSKMNIIGADTVQMLQAGVGEASSRGVALVVATRAPDFSAGANLMLVLIEAQDGNWDEVDFMVRSFQAATQALRYAPIPVIVATTGLTLAGGCEIALHADRVQAAAESYIGLVETGVGLIPAGGGTKEMVARATGIAAGIRADPLPFVQAAFETMALAKVSSSAAHARQIGYLRDHDEVTMNGDRLLLDAKAVALARARDGYSPPPPARIAVGGEAVSAALKLGVHLAWRAGRISAHDALVGRTLAHVMAGGELPHPTSVSESHLLDLEREAFLKLCGERKTLERIRHTLKTGKRLRN